MRQHQPTITLQKEQQNQEGGGTIIIRNAAQSCMGNPIICGQLPAQMQPTVAAVVAKDQSTWTHADCATMGWAMSWALTNLT